MKQPFIAGIRLSFLSVALALFQQASFADILFSEAHGAPQPYYPVSAGGQFMGFAFVVQQPVVLSAVHAEMGGGELGYSFFAAVVKVDPLTGLPQGKISPGNPFEPGEVLHYETFTMESEPIVPITIPSRIN
jgi:hypothetical protein